MRHIFLDIQTRGSALCAPVGGIASTVFTFRFPGLPDCAVRISTTPFSLCYLQSLTHVSNPHRTTVPQADYVPAVVRGTTLLVSAKVPLLAMQLVHVFRLSVTPPKLLVCCLQYRSSLIFCTFFFTKSACNKKTPYRSTRKVVPLLVALGPSRPLISEVT